MPLNALECVKVGGVRCCRLKAGKAGRPCDYAGQCSADPGLSVLSTAGDIELAQVAGLVHVIHVDALQPLHEVVVACPVGL